MANEKLIKVSDETKAAIEKLKESSKWGRTEGDVITKLIDYNKKAEAELQILRKRIDLDNEVMKGLAELKALLRIDIDNNALKVLLNHWSEATHISKETIALGKSKR